MRRALGDTPWRCVRRVVLPLLRPAMLGGALLVTLNILVEFGAFALMRRPVHYARIGRGAQRRGVPYALGVWQLPAVVGFAALAGPSLGVPILTVLYWLTRHGAAAITPAEASPLALLTAAISTIELRRHSTITASCR
jgi:iron(III) transport system permease protein